MFFFGFSIKGYSNALAFKNIDLEKIKVIEDFARVKLLPLLEKAYSKCDDTINDADLPHFFGLFAKDIENFQIFSGDKCLIMEMAQHIGRVVDKDGLNQGLAHFTAPEDHKIPRKKMVQLPIGLVFRTPDTHKAKGADLKLGLLSLVEKCYTKHNPEFAKRKLDLNNSVEVKNIGRKIFGEISCVLCPKRKQFRAQYDTMNQSLKAYWNTSNFRKHLAKHKLDDGPIEVIVPISSETSSEQDVESSAGTSGTDVADVGVDVPIDDDTSVIIIDYNSTTATNDDGDDAIGSRESIEEAIYKQIASQNLEMTKAIMTHNENLNTISCRFADGTKYVNVMEIDGDGNCLFASIAHQIFRKKIGSSNYLNETKLLRQEVVNHIIANFDEFKHQLTGRIYEEKEAKGIKCKRVQITDKDCMSFVTNRLKKRVMVVPSHSKPSVMFVM